MGSKPSTNMQSDRPESGGADHNSEHENSGLLEREKEKFAVEEHEKKETAPPQKPANHEAFSIGNEPNSDPRK